MTLGPAQMRKGIQSLEATVQTCEYRRNQLQSPNNGGILTKAGARLTGTSPGAAVVVVGGRGAEG